jgi:hypothetical protein
MGATLLAATKIFLPVPIPNLPSRVSPAFSSSTYFHPRTRADARATFLAASFDSTDTSSQKVPEDTLFFDWLKTTEKSFAID